MFHLYHFFVILAEELLRGFLSTFLCLPTSLQNEVVATTVQHQRLLVVKTGKDVCRKYFLCFLLEGEVQRYPVLVFDF